MRIEELFEQEVVLTESRTIAVIRSLAKKTTGMKNVKPIILQSPDDRTHYRVFVNDGKHFFTFEQVRGKPSKPIKLTAAKSRKESWNLRMDGWTEVDSKSFLSKHWFQIVSSFIAGGVIGTLLSPVAGPLAYFGPVIVNTIMITLSEVRNMIKHPFGGGFFGGGEDGNSGDGGDGGLSESILEESYAKVAKKYRGVFGGRIPRTAALQHPATKEVALYLTSRGKFIALRMKGDIITKEETITRREFLSETNKLYDEGWRPIDTRSWLSRNADRLGVVLVLIGTPLIGTAINSLGSDVQDSTTDILQQAAERMVAQDLQRMQDHLIRF